MVTQWVGRSTTHHLDPIGGKDQIMNQPRPSQTLPFQSVVKCKQHVGDWADSQSISWLQTPSEAVSKSEISWNISQRLDLTMWHVVSLCHDAIARPCLLEALLRFYHWGMISWGGVAKYSWQINWLQDRPKSVMIISPPSMWTLKHVLGILRSKSTGSLRVWSPETRLDHFLFSVILLVAVHRVYPNIGLR